MCSIGEDDFGDDGGMHSMIPAGAQSSFDESKNPYNGFCHKCGKEGDVYKLAARNAECRECFLAYVRHKFRATLGSSKILPKNARVLLICDGSAESFVLLNMLAHACRLNSHKRLHCEVKILYIDDFILLQPNVDLLKHFSFVRIFMALNTEFEDFVVALFDTKRTVFSFKNIEGYLNRGSKSDELAFANKVNEIASLTSRQDYIKHLRSQVITTAATQLNCNFAFVPDISSTLATQFLTAIALGRGASAAFDVALVDDRLGNGIKLVRPLKDLSAEEIKLYLHAENIKPLEHRSYGANQSDQASLQNLTAAFINNLQKNFPATVSTIFRSGAKLAAISERLKDNDNGESTLLQTCKFCNSVLDYADSTTLLATEFSRIMSINGLTTNKTDACFEEEAHKNVHKRTDKSNWDSLCHGCRNIQQDCAENFDLNMDVDN